LTLFEGSVTSILQLIFEGITQLKGAAASPKPTEFDLPTLVDEAVLAEASGRGVEVSLQGPRPMNISSDHSLLHHALANGLRNAVEATLECSAELQQPIVITWGETDVDYWLAVIDRGGGLIAAPEVAFNVGKSTKEGHSGFGLAIARQAMDTLGGSATLQPAKEGGTRYELRWER
jgi:signal transduction histidine kinase